MLQLRTAAKCRHRLFGLARIGQRHAVIPPHVGKVRLDLKRQFVLVRRLPEAPRGQQCEAIGVARNDVAGVETGALFCRLIIFALMGLFLRYTNQANARVRWISDSNYWIYVVHPLVLLGIQIALRDLHIAPVLKFVLTLGPSLGILFASYKWMVRGRWLGWLLNGTPRTKTESANPQEPVPTVADAQEA